MIKPFEVKDLESFLPNEYSKPYDMRALLSRHHVSARTLWGTDGSVQAIICFWPYWGDCWACFVLVSKNFIYSNALVLRELIGQYMSEHRAIRLQTESRADSILRNWHKFLGFRLEGTKRKMMFNQDYDMWAIVREGA